jgi:hypothetical protein
MTAGERPTPFEQGWADEDAAIAAGRGPSPEALAPAADILRQALATETARRAS